jgi:hypothetical protein
MRSGRNRKLALFRHRSDGCNSLVAAYAGDLHQAPIALSNLWMIRTPDGLWSSPRPNTGERASCQDCGRKVFPSIVTLERVK